MKQIAGDGYSLERRTGRGGPKSGSGTRSRAGSCCLPTPVAGSW